jgi:hypothetical protein
VHRRAKGFHQDAAIGFLGVAHLDHKDFTSHLEKAARHRERRAPLTGSGLCGKLFDAFLFVVERLCGGRVELVASGGAGAFVFVIDVCRCVEHLFQPPRG